MRFRCNRQPAFAYAPKPPRQLPQTGLASGSRRILSCSKLSAVRHSKQSSSGAFQVRAPCRACCRRGAGACGHPRSRSLRAPATCSIGSRPFGWCASRCLATRSAALVDVRSHPLSHACRHRRETTGEARLGRASHVSMMPARCECEMVSDIVRASFEHRSMQRWRARVAVTILKPLRRRITARAARERACRVEATRTVRVARRVADARLRGSAADVLAALDRIQSPRVPALAQRVPRVVAQNFSASPKAFVHAGFRLYTMSGNRHCRRAWKTRRLRCARRKSGARQRRLHARAMPCRRGIEHGREQRREGARDAMRAQRAQAKTRSAQRNDEDDEVVMLARKFFCTFFLTSPNKRIMIRLDKSLTSLHGCVAGKTARRNDEVGRDAQR